MAIRAGLAALALLSAAFWTGPAFAKGQCEPAADASAHPITRTPRLGVYFVQDGHEAPLSLPDAEPRQPAVLVATVRLRRAPFEIRIAPSAWSRGARDAGLAISASEEPCTESLLRLGQSQEETPLFGRYRAMADYPNGAGRLISARGGDGNDYGYNYIVDERFNASGDGYRGLLVSRIDRRYGDDDLMQGQAPVTLVFYLDRGAGHPATVRDQYGENDVIDATEVDVVRISFED